MMWRLIIFLILLIFSVFIGIEVTRHAGYLLLVYQPWMVQMPLWFVLVSIIVIFLVFYICVDSIDRLQFLVYKIKNWFRHRREYIQFSQTQQGLATLIEGRWKKAEQLLIRAVNESHDPLINYLAAARAAQAQNAFSRRDDYFKCAYQAAPQAEMAIGLTQAELEIDQHQYEHARATLNHLREIDPRHPRVLKLLETIYVRTADWKQLQLLLPALHKAKLINQQEAAQFEKNIYIALLKTEHAISFSSLQQTWDTIPKSMKKNPELVYLYVKQLIRYPEANKESEALIRKTLKENYHSGLVHIYGHLVFTDLNKQLVLADDWLQKYGPRPELLLLLAKLCMQVQLWGKAKDYFVKTLSFGPNPEALLLYGKLLTQLGETDLAVAAYQNNLALTVQKEGQIAP